MRHRFPCQSTLRAVLLEIRHVLFLLVSLCKLPRQPSQSGGNTSNAVVSACQQGEIPALHAADVQLSEQSLDVAASQWSQTKSARRKQKRRGNAKQLSPLDADSAASSSAQEDAVFQDVRGSSQSETSADAAVTSSAGAALPLGNPSDSKQRGTVRMPRMASPLGKVRLEGSTAQTTRQTQEQRTPTAGSQGSPGRAHQAPQDQWAAVQPLVRQPETQEDADALITVSKLTLCCMGSFQYQ